MGRVAGEHLVEHAAQRVDVAPAGQLLVGGGLLGAHVVRGAEAHAGFGHAATGGGTEREGDSEIGHHGAAVVQQDVFGFDVAMDHTLPVGIVQCVGHGDGDPDRVIDPELGFAVEAAAERLALDVRHHIVEKPAGLAAVEEREDMRVLQRGGGLDLDDEPLGAEDRGELRLEDLERDLPVVLQVAGQVDRGHPTPAELTLDPVPIGQSGGDRRGAIYHGSSGGLPGRTLHIKEKEASPILRPPTGLRQNGGGLEIPLRAASDPGHGGIVAPIAQVTCCCAGNTVGPGPNHPAIRSRVFRG